MSREATRRRRWIAWTAIGVVVAIVAGLGALRMHASRLDEAVHERAAASAAAPSRPAHASPREIPRPTLAAHPPRATIAPALAVTASSVARAADAAPPRLDEALQELFDDNPDATCVVHARLTGASRDRDVSVPVAVRAWLDRHAEALDVLAGELAADADGSVAIAALDGLGRALPGASAVLHDQQRYVSAEPLHCILVADAVRWAEDRQPDVANESMEALYTLSVALEDAGVVLWIADPGVLRRVRPRNAATWSERLDAHSPPQRIIGTIRNRALMHRPDGPIPLGNETLEVLHDDLPNVIRRPLDAAVLAPLADAQWARRSMALLDIYDDLIRSDECLPARSVEDAPPDPEGDLNWRETWRRAIVEEADHLVAREVLRLAHPEAGIEARPSPCPDWSIEVETLADGTRRVKAVGSVRDLPPTISYTPPLEYELPPPAR